MSDWVASIFKEGMSLIAVPLMLYFWSTKALNEDDWHCVNGSILS